MGIQNCTLPKIEERDEGSIIAGDILTSALEIYLSKESTNLQFVDDLQGISIAIEELLERRLREPLDRFIAGLFMIYFKRPQIYTAIGEEREKLINEARSEIVILAKEEILSLKPNKFPHNLKSIFHFYSSINALVFLSNISAILCPRITNSADLVLSRLVEKTYGMKAGIGKNPSVRLHSVQPFTKVMVHSDLYTTLQYFVREIKPHAMGSKRGDYLYISEQVIDFLDTEINEEIVKRESSLPENLRIIDPEKSEKEQDEIYQEIVSQTAQNIYNIILAFINEIDKTENKLKINEIADLISETQKYLTNTISDMIQAGIYVYDPESLSNSISSLAKTIKEKGLMNKVEYCSLVCLLPVSLFNWQEAETFWEHEYSGKREEYIAASKEFIAYITKSIEINNAEREKSIKFLINSIDTPLRQSASIGMTNLNLVYDKLGINKEYYEKYSQFEVFAAVNTYVLNHDDFFYEQLSLFAPK